MKAVRTVETARVVDPNTRVNIRVQSISRIRPEAPERKKQARTTTRMGPAIYHFCDGRPLTRGAPSSLVPGTLTGSRPPRDELARAKPALPHAIRSRKAT